MLTLPFARSKSSIDSCAFRVWMLKASSCKEERTVSDHACTKKKKKERKHDLSCVCVCLGECVVFKIMDTLLTAVLRYSCWVYVRVLCIAYSDFDAILFVQLRAVVGAISCSSISRTYVCAFCKCVCEFWRCVSVVV